MKLLLIEVEDRWKPGRCGVCINPFCRCKDASHENACPLANANAKTVVEVNPSNDFIEHGIDCFRVNDGNTCKLYAVEEK